MFAWFKKLFCKKEEAPEVVGLKKFEHHAEITLEYSDGKRVTLCVRKGE